MAFIANPLPYRAVVLMVSSQSSDDAGLRNVRPEDA
jgi:hypothetical protein